MIKGISSRTGPLNVLKSRKDWYTNTPCRVILWYSDSFLKEYEKVLLEKQTRELMNSLC